LYCGDVGLGVHLADDMPPSRAHLENIVLHDLLVWRETLSRRAEIMYWRTSNGGEVDFVVANGNHLRRLAVRPSAKPDGFAENAVRNMCKHGSFGGDPRLFGL
jgi:predicted AAA+ superfamily ATPase